MRRRGSASNDADIFDATALLRNGEQATTIRLATSGDGFRPAGPELRDRPVRPETLTKAGLATPLLDLLTAGEEAVDMPTARLRFGIGLLASRVVGAIDWLVADAGVGDLPPRAARLPVGCFGASTGAAAARLAAAERPDRVAAVVSRGGRPDLTRRRAPARHRADAADRGRAPHPGARAQPPRAGAARRPSRLVVVPGGGAGSPGSSPSRAPKSRSSSRAPRARASAAARRGLAPSAASCW
jgi:hypothetical protein